MSEEQSQNTAIIKALIPEPRIAEAKTRLRLVFIASAV